MKKPRKIQPILFKQKEIRQNSFSSVKSPLIPESMTDCRALTKHPQNAYGALSRRQTPQQKPPLSLSANPRQPTRPGSRFDLMRPIQKNRQPNKPQENPSPLLSNHKMRQRSKPRPPQLFCSLVPQRIRSPRLAALLSKTFFSATAKQDSTLFWQSQQLAAKDWQRADLLTANARWCSLSLFLSFFAVANEFFLTFFIFFDFGVDSLR